MCKVDCICITMTGMQITFDTQIISGSGLGSGTRTLLGSGVVTRVVTQAEALDPAVTTDCIS